MGVPGLFRRIVKNKKTHSPDFKKAINYFLIDFNGTVYRALPRLLAEMKLNKLSYNKKNIVKFEKDLINMVIEYTRNIICNVVKPTALVYIAADGPAPRAKMVQQRSRRYKGIKEKMYVDSIKHEHDVDILESWNASSNMAPGTEFMYNLTQAMKKAIEKGVFSKGSKRDVIFSSGQVPGEGEHKFMPYIRRMVKSKTLKNKTVCIYSGDGDLIPLTVVTGKNNIFIMMESDRIEKKDNPEYEGRDWVITDVDEVKKGLHRTLSKGLKNNHGIELERFVTDYAFLLSLGGNDFIHGLPFTVVKNQGIDDYVLPFYREVYDELGKYLITVKGSKVEINMEFLKRIFQELASIEEDFMNNYQVTRIDRYMEGFINSGTIKKEYGMTPYDKAMSRFQHMEIQSSHHMLHDMYAADFRKIDYTKDPEDWKPEYYKFYMGLEQGEDYQSYLNKVCEKYLGTLYWNIQYYVVGCPSWSFYYGYRVSPMPSDVLAFMQSTEFDINKIEFDLGKPYTPYEQLMFILPPQMKDILPEPMADLMVNPAKLLVPYYPVDFRIDATVGRKWMYSEAILPEFDDEQLLKAVRKIEKDELTPKQKLMNKVEMKPMIKRGGRSNNSGAKAKKPKKESGAGK